jgi:DNA-binding MarR family transcriptional regulator
MMMVNRANVTGLVDRLEKAGLVRRTATGDRRYNMIKLTDRGLRFSNRPTRLTARRCDRSSAG